jgi:hypothetical protein
MIRRFQGISISSERESSTEMQGGKTISFKACAFWDNEVAVIVDCKTAGVFDINVDVETVVGAMISGIVVEDNAVSVFSTGAIFSVGIADSDILLVLQAAANPNITMTTATSLNFD